MNKLSLRGTPAPYRLRLGADWVRQFPDRASTVKVRTKTGRYETTYTPGEVTETSEGEFELVIDVERLFRMLAWKASTNRSGKSRLSGDCITIKRTRAKVVDRKVETKPLPESYELIEGAPS